MGEHAEDAYDRAIDELFCGEEQDYYEAFAPLRAPRQESKTCDRCGAVGLRWARYWDPKGAERFRLTTPAGAVHDCSAKADPDDFDVVG